MRDVDPSTTVDAFTQRLVSEVGLGVHAAHVSLRLLPTFPGDDPSEALEQAASELHPRRTLQAAGVEDGRSLLADVDAQGGSGEGAPCCGRACASAARVRSAGGH